VRRTIRLIWNDPSWRPERPSTSECMNQGPHSRERRAEREDTGIEHQMAYVNQQKYTIEENANIASCILTHCNQDQMVY